MIVSVMVEDYITNSVFNTIFDEDDMEFMLERWFEQDSLLMGLQNTKEFDGLTTLNDLKAWHFHFLITNTLELLFALPESVRKDPESPEIRSFENMVSAFLFYMVEQLNSRVEFVKIQRVAPGVVNFDYRASIMLELKYPEPKPGLLVVIDNSKTNGRSAETEPAS